MNAILGTKIGQSQMFTEDGTRISVTTVQAGPCWIVKVIKGQTYTSLQLAFGSKKQIAKSLEGQIKKAGLTIKPRFLRELRVTDPEKQYEVGSEIKLSEVLTVGDPVRVTGVSKGKGFAGVVKRHGFRGGPRTHGQSDRERAPGSIGQTTTPGRVYRGKRMAGRMGSDTVTVKGLKVIHIDEANNVLTVKGLIPGGKGSLVTVRKEV